MTENRLSSPADPSPLPSSDPMARNRIDGPVAGATAALALLVCINLFNYIDRQVLAAVEPAIRRHFFTDSEALTVASTVGLLASPQTSLFSAAAVLTERHDARDSMSYMGLLSTAFLVTYMLAAPIFGWLANRMSRWVLVGIGVMIWSLASGGSGLATGYLALLLTRCFVGIGEAVFGPISPDMISDLYPVERRGSMLSYFYAAIPFGGALGYALGDGLLRVTSSWRIPFYAVVIPGLLLGVVCFFMPEPRRGHKHQHVALSDYLVLLRIPSYVLNTLGMAAMTFAIGGLAFWVPGYLEMREVKSLGPIGATTAFGAITALTGLLATLAGGVVGDRLRKRLPGSYFIVSGVALLLAFPLLLIMIEIPFPLAWIPLALAVFCLFFNTGPTNAILANVCPPLLRAPGFALNILIIHILGDAISPPLMGRIAHLTDLNWAFRVVSAVVLLGGIIWLWGARYLARDTALAPTRLETAR